MTNSIPTPGSNTNSGSGTAATTTPTNPTPNTNPTTSTTTSTSSMAFSTPSYTHLPPSFSVQRIDYFTHVLKLDAKGKNWSIFQECWKIAVQGAGLGCHFDHTYVVTVPSPGETNQTILTEYAKWQQEELQARSHLTGTLADSTLRKAIRGVVTVRQVWERLEDEFQHKSEVMKANLRADFMAMHCGEHANVREFLDKLTEAYNDPGSTKSSFPWFRSHHNVHGLCLLLMTSLIHCNENTIFRVKILSTQN
ncbi:hypothetical protein IW262DRAFT_1415918 [Armillaria fumosa]|nr:hypothetical protein IW262DRAFT_1415918 [Armillaria fumosa]